MDTNPPPVNSAPGIPYVLRLKDNSRTDIDPVDDGILDLLDFFNNKTLAQIRNESPDATDGLLLLGRIEDIKQDNPIYTLFRPEKDGKLSLSIKTGNIMGVFTLRKGNVAVRLVIDSRFDDTDEQPFLCWMLERVLKVNLADFVQSSSGEFWTILLELLFWHKLGEASSIGLYRQYQKMEYNDLRFRGRLDIDRHIRLNMPLWDKIAYSRREIVFDNPINHLLRHAANIIISKWSKTLLNGSISMNKEARNMLMAIETNTPSWTPSNLNTILWDRITTRRISQPYYAEYYEILRILARCIILRLGVDVYSDSSAGGDYSINGIILDGAWLWEEYLSSIMTAPEFGFWHAIPDTRTLPIYAMSKEKERIKKRRPLYPDFRLPTSEAKDDPSNSVEQKASVVLDAKYKYGDAKDGISVRRTDMHQCLAYMLLTGAKVGGVIYPPNLNKQKTEDDEKDDEESFFWDVNVPDSQRFWKSFTFRMWDKNKDFNEEMRDIENEFKQYLQDVIDKAKSPEAKKD